MQSHIIRRAFPSPFPPERGTSSSESAAAHLIDSIYSRKEAISSFWSLIGPTTKTINLLKAEVNKKSLGLFLNL